jgi:hypothetical protein
MQEEGEVVVVMVGHLGNDEEGGMACSSRSDGQAMGGYCHQLAPGSHQNSILATDKLSFDL